MSEVESHSPSLVPLYVMQLRNKWKYKVSQEPPRRRGRPRVTEPTRAGHRSRSVLPSLYALALMHSWIPWALQQIQSDHARQAADHARQAADHDRQAVDLAAVLAAMNLDPDQYHEVEQVPELPFGGTEYDDDISDDGLM